jgi:hypothetical protein
LKSELSFELWLKESEVKELEPFLNSEGIAIMA